MLNLEICIINGLATQEKTISSQDNETMINNHYKANIESCVVGPDPRH